MEVLILETELPYTHRCEMMWCQALSGARAALKWETSWKSSLAHDFDSNVKAR